MNTSELMKRHYDHLFQKHGDSPQACQWTDENSQIFRFKQLATIADLEGKRILDVGCGLGDFYQYLKAKNISVDYTGVDLVEGMIDVAAKKYPSAKFIQWDIIEKPLVDQFDYVFMSGIFNFCENNDEENYVNLRKMIDAAYKQCLVGIGFNFISSHVNFRDEGTGYYSPNDVLAYCIQNLSPKVVLHHHYEKCDVAVFVYR